MLPFCAFASDKLSGEIFNFEDKQLAAGNVTKQDTTGWICTFVEHAKLQSLGKRRSIRGECSRTLQMKGRKIKTLSQIIQPKIERVTKKIVLIKIKDDEPLA